MTTFTSYGHVSEQRQAELIQNLSMKTSGETSINRRDANACLSVLAARTAERDRLTKREAELVAENNSMRWQLTELGQRLATAEGRADELSRALKEQP